MNIIRTTSVFSVYCWNFFFHARIPFDSAIVIAGRRIPGFLIELFMMQDIIKEDAVTLFS
ncbi:hypothetical protein HMPREF1981_03501 [Bacteroides pyogenes F0041]|uniref:Uncharacterized protein n=1 Tax=Bacteroides pyogenes F0041 TaxID=1321819 RepID=U2C8S1_9BACE|nr:hypothetical protein HMPREF1981_03501 [Bacteroides pyogenes F0041]GAE23347.1 hypothetical protein JCM10003_3092 [Bacteroides pyogenes JCM 10003]